MHGRASKRSEFDRDTNNAEPAELADGDRHPRGGSPSVPHAYALGPAERDTEPAASLPGSFIDYRKHTEGAGSSEYEAIGDELFRPDEHPTRLSDFDSDGGHTAGPPTTTTAAVGSFRPAPRAPEISAPDFAQLDTCVTSDRMADLGPGFSEALQDGAQLSLNHEADLAQQYVEEQQLNLKQMHQYLIPFQEHQDQLHFSQQLRSQRHQQPDSQSHRQNPDIFSKYEQISSILDPSSSLLRFCEPANAQQHQGQEEHRNEVFPLDEHWRGICPPLAEGPSSRRQKRYRQRETSPQNDAGHMQVRNQDLEQSQNQPRRQIFQQHLRRLLLSREPPSADTPPLSHGTVHVGNSSLPQGSDPADLGKCTANAPQSRITNPVLQTSHSPADAVRVEDLPIETKESLPRSGPAFPRHGAHLDACDALSAGPTSDLHVETAVEATADDPQIVALTHADDLSGASNQGQPLMWSSRPCQSPAAPGFVDPDAKSYGSALPHLPADATKRDRRRNNSSDGREHPEWVGHPNAGLGPANSENQSSGVLSRPRDGKEPRCGAGILSSPGDLPLPSTSRSMPSSATKPGRRKTVRWNPAEVEALLGGVRELGVGKWAAILRMSSVFAKTRTSIDLKDKWRNVSSTVRGQIIAEAEEQEMSTETFGKDSGADGKDDEMVEDVEEGDACGGGIRQTGNEGSSDDAPSDGDIAGPQGQSRGAIDGTVAADGKRSPSLSETANGVSAGAAETGQKLRGALTSKEALKEPFIPEILNKKHLGALEKTFTSRREDSPAPLTVSSSVTPEI